MNPAEPYELHPGVALRPESFGALVYHYGNRRLAFVKHPDLVVVLESLAAAPSVDAALDAASIAPARRPAFLRALESLEASEVVRPRSEESAA